MPQSCRNVNPYRKELFERSEYDMQMLKTYGQSAEQYQQQPVRLAAPKPNWYAPKPQGQPRHI